MKLQKLRKHFQARPRDAHKGDHGHVLVIGGDHGMPGAVRLAGEAALRVGAGLVTVVTRPGHIHVVVGSRPEIMCYGMTSLDDLPALLERANVVVVGPGLGTRHWGWELCLRAVASGLPCVCDAGALNLLSEHPQRHDHWILTPHPGEAAKLLNTDVLTVQAGREHAADILQQRYGGVVVLKGAGTVVKAEGEEPRVCETGNPGMATAGMGDVLTGVIAGLLAQGKPLLDAATLGVWVHGHAGDLAASEIGQRGLLALDLVERLPIIVNPR